MITAENFKIHYSWAKTFSGVMFLHVVCGTKESSDVNSDFVDGVTFQDFESALKNVHLSVSSDDIRRYERFRDAHRPKGATSSR